jgi:hypothetical protein
VKKITTQEKTMDKMHFTIHINAPKEKVWKTMLTDETYRQWTAGFMPGSRFEGSWDQGSRILFLAPDENGKDGGMVARIAENRPYEFISIEHLGEIRDGVEDTESDAVKQWAGAREEYTLREVNGGVDVDIDVDIPEEYKEEMTKMWPDALQRLKELSEE